MEEKSENRHQEKNLLTIAAVSAGLMLATPALQATAATMTWKDGPTQSCSTYSEGTIYNSRDGIRAYLPEIKSGQGQLIRMTVYFGTAYQTAWTADLTQMDTRSYKAGKFTWRNDTCQDTTTGRGIALNAGRLGQRAPETAPETASETAPDGELIAAGDDADIAASYPVLHTSAEEYEIDVDMAVFLANYDGLRVWTIQDADQTYVLTATENGAGSVAKVATAELASRAFTMLTNEDGTVKQLVIVAPTFEDEVAAATNLLPLGNGVFADEEAATRSEDDRTSVASDSARGTNGYEVVLFGNAGE